MRAIAGHQQPAGETCFHQVKSRTGRRLHELRKKDIQVAIEGGARCRIAFDLACESGCVDAPRMAGTLNEGAQRRHIDAEQQRHSQHSFVADQADLELPAADARSDQ